MNVEYVRGIVINIYLVITTPYNILSMYHFPTKYKMKWAFMLQQKNTVNVGNCVED